MAETITSILEFISAARERFTEQECENKKLADAIEHIAKEITSLQRRISRLENDRKGMR